MARLKWHHWNLSESLKKACESTNHAGINYRAILWVGMRRVFLAKDGNEGLLYNGDVYEAARKNIIDNDHVYHFDFDDLDKMLERGDFKYKNGRYDGYLSMGTTNRKAWASSDPGGWRIRFNITEMAKKDGVFS